MTKIIFSALIALGLSSTAFAKHPEYDPGQTLLGVVQVVNERCIQINKKVFCWDQSVVPVNTIGGALLIKDMPDGDDGGVDGTGERPGDPWGDLLHNINDPDGVEGLDEIGNPIRTGGSVI